MLLLCCVWELVEWLGRLLLGVLTDPPPNPPLRPCCSLSRPRLWAREFL